jgi:TonB family protein
VRTGITLKGIICLGLMLSRSSQAQQFDRAASTINPNDTKVANYSELKYPSLARIAQGVVVVRAKLDKSGRVIDAEALSGNDALVADTLTNVKSWRFEPNASGIAMVVYNFRIIQGRCKSASSLFTFERPNLATITACWPESSASAVGNVISTNNAHAMVSDNEMVLLDYEEMKYPILGMRIMAAGLVVVQARLNEDGNVVEAFPVFGHGLLTSNCLTNVKKWRFKPNAKKMAVVAYRFAFTHKMAPEGQEQFVLYPPNFVTLTTPSLVIR